MKVLNQNLNRAFVSFELTPAIENSVLDSYKRILSKCCIDRLRPPGLSVSGNCPHGGIFPLGTALRRVYFGAS